MKYHFRIHKERAGYWAEGVEISWANTQARTRGELAANMKEVLELCLEEPEDSSRVLPLPDPGIKGRNIVEVSPDPKVALAAMVRRERMAHRLTQKAAAARMGIRHLRQYQRLESGKTANAVLETLARIKKAYPGFSLDAVF